MPAPTLTRVPLVAIIVVLSSAGCQPDTVPERDAERAPSPDTTSTTLDTVRAAPVEAAPPPAVERASPPVDSAFLAKVVDSPTDWRGPDGWKIDGETSAAIGLPYFWGSYRREVRPEHVYFNAYGDMAVGDSLWVHIGRGERLRGAVSEIYEGGSGLCGLGCDEGGSCHRRAVLDIAAADTARTRAASPVFVVTHLDTGDSPLRVPPIDENAPPPDSIGAVLDQHMDRVLERHVAWIVANGGPRSRPEQRLSQLGLDSAGVSQTLTMRSYRFDEGRRLLRVIGDWRRQGQINFALGVDFLLEEDSLAAWSVVTDVSLYYGDEWDPPVERAVAFYDNWFDFDADGDPEFVRRGIGYESCSLTLSEWRRTGRVMLYRITDGV